MEQENRMAEENLEKRENRAVAGPERRESGAGEENREKRTDRDDLPERAKPENKMGVKPVPGLLITMAIPLVFSLLIQSLYNIVDGIFVAKLSEKALTATSLAYPLQLLMVAIGVGTSVGLNACLSRSVGEKNRERSSHIATTGMILSLISAALFLYRKFRVLETQKRTGVCRTYVR